MHMCVCVLAAAKGKSRPEMQARMKLEAGWMLAAGPHLAGAHSSTHRPQRVPFRDGGAKKEKDTAEGAGNSEKMSALREIKDVMPRHLFKQ